MILGGLRLTKRSWVVLLLVLPLCLLFAYAALRSGPLAPVKVVVKKVEEKALSPSLFGIGTVEARYVYQVGVRSPGRLATVRVDVGDRVEAGQLLATVDPVDLEQRVRAVEAAIRGAQAQLEKLAARRSYARRQKQRYEDLSQTGSGSLESAESKALDLQVAAAAHRRATQELAGLRAERAVLEAQLQDLSLVAPADALVVAREVEPGTAVVAGQTVLELIDPEWLWVDLRLDQLHAQGLERDLSAQITLRSRLDAVYTGKVFRVEVLADAVTEELMAKVVFEPMPARRPAIGELAEVTIARDPLPAAPVISNAAIRHRAGQTGVWQISEGALQFTPVTLGAADLQGKVQVTSGLSAGDTVVLYSEDALRPKSRIERVEGITEVSDD